MLISSASKLLVRVALTSVRVLMVFLRVAHSNQEIAVLNHQSYTIKHIFINLPLCFSEIKPKSNAPRLWSKSTEIFGRVPDILYIWYRFHNYFYHSFVIYILNKDSFQWPKNWIGFRFKNILLVAVLSFKINDGRSNSFSQPFNKTMSESKFLPAIMAAAIFGIVSFSMWTVFIQSLSIWKLSKIGLYF